MRVRVSTWIDIFHFPIRVTVRFSCEGSGLGLGTWIDIFYLWDRRLVKSKAAAWAATEVHVIRTFRVAICNPNVTGIGDRPHWCFEYKLGQIPPLETMIIAWRTRLV